MPDADFAPVQDVSGRSDWAVSERRMSSWSARSDWAMKLKHFQKVRDADEVTSLNGLMHVPGALRRDAGSLGHSKASTCDAGGPGDSEVSI